MLYRFRQFDLHRLTLCCVLLLQALLFWHALEHPVHLPNHLAEHECVVCHFADLPSIQTALQWHSDAVWQLIAPVSDYIIPPCDHCAVAYQPRAPPATLIH